MSDVSSGFIVLNPNTLGLFEEDILEIAKIVLRGRRSLYYDGANLRYHNGESVVRGHGLDVVHVQPSKTFPHPMGSALTWFWSVGVKAHLAEFLFTQYQQLNLRMINTVL